MDGILELMGGLGMLGLLVAFLLGVIVLLVLPWCCLVECVRSDRASGVRAFPGRDAGADLGFRQRDLRAVRHPLAALAPFQLGFRVADVDHRRSGAVMLVPAHGR